MYGSDVLIGIPTVPFEIQLKKSNPYLERFVFYSQVKIQELLALRNHKCFEPPPPPPPEHLD